MEKGEVESVGCRNSQSLFISIRDNHFDYAYHEDVFFNAGNRQ